MVDVLESLVEFLSSGRVDSFVKSAYVASSSTGLSSNIGGFVEELYARAARLKEDFDSALLRGVLVPSDKETDQLTVLFASADTHSSRCRDFVFADGREVSDSFFCDFLQLAFRVTILEKSIQYLSNGRTLPSDGSLTFSPSGTVQHLSINLEASTIPIERVVSLQGDALFLKSMEYVRTSPSTATCRWRWGYE